MTRTISESFKRLPGNMKHELRVPTKEQYAYINFEFEGTSDDAIAEYRRLTLAVKEAQGEFAGKGLETKEFNRVLDRYIWTDGKMSADEYAEMNQEQQMIIQTIKRSRARVKDAMPATEQPI